jgi:hypothetical protein
MTPNDASVVLQLGTVAGDVLLGADLEHFRGVRTRGWHAVIDHDGRPACSAGIFKVAHHGSKDADCPEVWEHMIDESPISVVTPFERGSVILPRDGDRDRIRQRSAVSFLASAKRRVVAKRTKVIEKTIAEASRLYRPEVLVMGHVQMRSSGSDWTIRRSEAVTAL